MKKQTDTARVAPLAPYLGGKFRLSKRIIDKIEQIPHTIYAEPFVGMAASFCGANKSRKPKSSTTSTANWSICT